MMNPEWSILKVAKIEMKSGLYSDESVDHVVLGCDAMYHLQDYTAS
jgi:hypothetical protein